MTITAICLLIAGAAFLLGICVGLELQAAPLCTCNDPACDGGCIDWEPR